ncbi:hypothetical protein FSP39_010417 [Pinctada imbricata]|uniref:Amino acid transporter n=1 Tax=Pinctada imbricata TaxID=66713 RepID=A0AA89BZD6_PINIB|nr:hypothetical protein FSP39_010417 [Pinctada imbricata]
MKGTSRFLRNHGLLLSVILGAVIGFCFGFGLRGHTDEVTIMWLGLPGDVYMRLLKMSILPLVVSGIITGASSLNAKSSGKIGMVSIFYILITNAIGAFLGIIIFYMFKLGVIVICTLFGIATTKINEQAKKSFLDFFAAVTEVVMVVLKWVIWFSGIGVASLVAASIASVSDIKTVFKEVGLFVLAHAIGNIFLCVLWGIICFSVLKRANPLPFLLSCIKPLATAIAPPSTAIAIPVMLTTLERDHDIDKRISRFLVPLSTALVRCGSCMFITLSVLFLMTLEGKHVSVLDVFLTGDRLRTVSNLVAMMFGNILLQHICEKDLQELQDINCLENCLDISIDIDENDEKASEIIHENGKV